MKTSAVLNKLLHVPFEDEIAAQRARALLILTLSMWIVDVWVMVQSIVAGFRWDYVILNLIALLVFAAIFWFTRRGHRWPNYVFLVFLTVFIPYAFREGLGSPAVLAFAIPIVVAPLIAVSWSAIPVAAAETVFLYLFSLQDNVAFNYMGVALVGVLGLVSWLSSSNLERALQRVRNTAQALTEANLELETGRVLLEDHSRELERRTSYLEATTRVARGIALELELNELLNRVVHLISERFGFYHAAVFLLDPTAEWAILQAASSPGGQQMLARGYRLRIGKPSPVNYVIEHGVARISLNVDDDEMLFDKVDLPETRSAMTLPLRARGETLGALDVQSDERGVFTDEDAAVLQSLADQIAVAISNARLFAQLQRSLEAQRRVYGELSRDAWVQLLRERPDLGYRSTERGVIRIEGDALRPGALKALKMGSLVEGDVAEDAERIPLVVPIKSPAGQIIGTIDTYKPASKGEWTEDERALLSEVSERLGSALESAQFYYESQRRAAREQLTREISGEMRQSIDMEAILRAAVTSLGQALGAPKTYIRLMLGQEHSDVEEPDRVTGIPSAFPPGMIDASGQNQGDEQSEP